MCTRRATFLSLGLNLIRIDWTRFMALLNPVNCTNPRRKTHWTYDIVVVFHFEIFSGVLKELTETWLCLCCDLGLYSKWCETSAFRFDIKFVILLCSNIWRNINSNLKQLRDAAVFTVSHSACKSIQNHWIRSRISNVIAGNLSITGIKWQALGRNSVKGSFLGISRCYNVSVPTMFLLRWEWIWRLAWGQEVLLQQVLFLSIWTSDVYLLNREVAKEVILSIGS